MFSLCCIKNNSDRVKKKKNTVKRYMQELPWQSSGYDAAYPMQGHKSDSWSGNYDPMCHVAKK